MLEPKYLPITTHTKSILQALFFQWILEMLTIIILYKRDVTKETTYMKPNASQKKLLIYMNSGSNVNSRKDGNFA